ncbi:hypothetical protein [Pontibacter sp. G13]|uniref:hypothetical protein n=1 Tax=Pontibacter sp. G13 TaxID=3074898 RepID=UPI00288961E7|nr:hypothetical protein [Pontibacter sp. G13]WNJ20540.1 hypothetical protein RJD25_08660 [Pontibacter sp. G13]
MNYDYFLTEEEKLAKLEKDFAIKGSLWSTYASSSMNLQAVFVIAGAGCFLFMNSFVGLVFGLGIWFGGLLGIRAWVEMKAKLKIEETFAEWKEKKAQMEETLMYQNHLKISQLQGQIEEIEEKATRLQKQIFTSETFMEKLQVMLADPDLDDSLEASSRSNEEELGETISVKKALLSFYRDSIDVLSKQIKNLQYQIELAQVEDYIEGSSENTLTYSGEVEDAHISLTFLHEMRSLEHDIPDMNSQSISRESRRLLADRLAELRSEHFRG